MWFSFLIIGFGGFLGAIARYALFLVDRKFYYETNFPFGTLAVNLLGSLLIGIALGLSLKHHILSRGSFPHYLWITGFLGAFTTFSTFTQDSFQLLLDKNYRFFAENIFLNVVLGIGLVALGYRIGSGDFWR